MNILRNCLRYRYTQINRNKSILRRTFSLNAEHEQQKSYTWLLVFPIATFGLGTWQVRRLEWKKGLIKDMEERTKANPVPYDTRDMLIPGRAAQMEYKPVMVEGHFDHSKEVLLGPRGENDHGKNNSPGLIAHGKSQVGYHVVTPFVLDNGDRILVNRGWVSSNNRDSKTREAGQVTDRILISGLVRKNENRPQFSQKVKEDSLLWNYSDLYGISNILNTLPLMIDADEKSSVPGGPIGGQTRVTMRNEHLSYIITWYSLSVLTFILWYQLRRKPSSMYRGPKNVE